jgi:hypothetical protein
MFNVLGIIVPYHHGMVLLQGADGGNDLHFRRAAANVLNKQSWTWVGPGLWHLDCGNQQPLTIRN